YSPVTSSRSSGLSLHLLHDDRRNPINPNSGFYTAFIYRYNSTYLGSDNDWQSLIVDLRKYIKVPRRGRTDNTLAFWSYSWFSFGGKTPYLDLPSTAWDTYSNMGRGYTQSRLRGANLLYLESEYRFGIMKNGLLGGVVFVNAQSVSDWPSKKFTTIWPGAGVGLRIKINKHSNTSIAIDYGFGLENSRGFFVNLGEVF
ncbi:MAG: BamA/TamA family outer membrane protein, partial [Bacteroidia bacterium]